MTGRLAILAALLSAGCGGTRSASPAPQTLTDALTQFMSAVKANDLHRMGRLWGTERGPAGAWMDARTLHMRLTVIQRYLAHSGYRVIEGPIVPASGSPMLRTFRIELQREGCNTVLPIDLVRTKSGGWLVYDVHLESAGNPAARCQPERAGTPR